MLPPTLPDRGFAVAAVNGRPVVTHLILTVCRWLPVPSL